MDDVDDVDDMRKEKKRKREINVLTLKFVDQTEEEKYQLHQARRLVQTIDPILAARSISIAIVSIVTSWSNTADPVVKKVSSLHVCVFVFMTLVFLICKKRFTQSLERVQTARRDGGEDTKRHTVVTYWLVHALSANIFSEVLLDSFQNTLTAQNNFMLAGIAICASTIVRLPWTHCVSCISATVLGAMLGEWHTRGHVLGVLLKILPTVPLSIVVCRVAEDAKRNTYVKEMSRRDAERVLEQTLDINVEEGADFLNRLSKMIQRLSQELQESKCGERNQREYMWAMAHELRSPLTSVLGCSDMLIRSPDLKNEDVQMTKLLHVSAVCLHDLINDTIDLYKLTHNPEAIVLANNVFTISSLVDTLRDLYMIHAKVQDVRIHFQVSDQYKDMYLCGDIKRIEQIISSLINCALNMTKEGDEINCSLTVIDKSEGDTYMRPHVNFVVSITDTGHGLPLNEATTLFDPFNKHGFVAKTDVKLTSLSLAIADRVVQLMGSAPINVRSKAGKGTTFDFSVPLSSIHMPNNTKLVATSKEVESGEGVLKERTREKLRSETKVLLVDATPTVRMITKYMLHKNGVDTVVTCDSGAEAVRLITLAHDRTQQFDVVLMGFRVTGPVNGVQATRKIHAQLGERAPPVIGFTADDSAQTMHAFTNAGAVDVLTKPVKAAQLVRVLRRVLKQE